MNAAIAKNETPLVSTAEAGRYLGLSPRTLERLRVIGGGPLFVKLGRRVLYRREDLDAFIAARVRTSTSDPGIEVAGHGR